MVVNGAEANKILQQSNNQLWGMVETEGDDSNTSLQVWRRGLSRKHNHPQLLAYYTTHVTTEKDNTNTIPDIYGQGTSEASNGGVRGKEQTK